MRILIADDDPITRRMLEAILTKWGYEVVIAQDGDQAWQVLESAEAPKLAILDWMMPGIDGVEVCRRARQRLDGPYVYMILLTAKIRQEDIIEGMEAGADDYLTKPFDRHELEVRLRAGLRILDLQEALLSFTEELTQARQQEIEIGTKIQHMLLRGEPPVFQAGLDLAVVTVPSQQIEGDFYDFYRHNDHCLDLVVGDVTGKGTAAAILAAATKNHFLRALQQGLPGSEPNALPRPEEIVTRVHDAVTGQFLGVDCFETLCYARFDMQARQVDFVDCGHTPTIHYQGRTATCTTMAGDNMPLGFSQREIYRQSSTQIEAGDMFLFYSEGVTAAQNESGEPFGLERLLKLVQANGLHGPGEAVARIHAAIQEFSGPGGSADDLTCLAVKMGEPESPK